MKIGLVGLRGTWSSCNLPVFNSVYTYKASVFKRTTIRLHCATSKSSLWYRGYVPRGGAFERPRIYRISMYIPHLISYTSFCHGMIEKWCQSLQMVTVSSSVTMRMHTCPFKMWFRNLNSKPFKKRMTDINCSTFIGHIQRLCHPH